MSTRPLSGAAGAGLERGRNPREWNADVRYVASSENRSHAASLGAQLEGFCKWHAVPLRVPLIVQCRFRPVVSLRERPVGWRVMANASGFWSYVHADDETDHGRISELARDVVEQFNMLTGESIDLFLDRDALEWGDRWKAKVDASLASIAFFIP